MKVVGLLVATVLALASTSALSLRSDSTAADSGPAARASGADARSGDRSTTSTRAGVADDARESAGENVVAADGIATLPPESAVAAATLDLGTTDASDGALNVSANTTINLGLAASLCDCDGGGQLDDPCRWDCPSPDPGKGIYDAERWAVVFKYSSVNISAGTVNFQNHPSRAPVVWLVQGNVTIAGSLSVAGVAGHVHGARTLAEPGPGGFRGGRGADSLTRGSGGFGPGGGTLGADSGNGTSGSHAYLPTVPPGGGAAGPAYGNGGVFPLIGGSGGAGSADWSEGNGGGGGGGAILIASISNVQLGGAVRADGGSDGAHHNYGGGGSGGAIRIVADAVTGGGQVTALGGYGYHYGAPGRIRVEANLITLSDLGNPAYTIGVPGGSPRIWPETDTPTVEVISMGGVPIPADPRAAFTFPGTDVSFQTAATYELVVRARNVPLGAGTAIRARAVDRSEPGAPPFNDFVNAAFDSGDDTESIWKAQVPLNNGYAAIQVRATFPPVQP